MRTILFSFFTLLLISSSFGQTIPEPLQLNRNVLVNSAGLPEEYLLFVPDTVTQIFFNPARAGSYKGNFVYVNYFSDYSPSDYAYLNAAMDYSDISAISTTGPIVLSKGAGAPFSFPTINEEIYNSSRNPSFSIASLIDKGDVKWLFSLSNGIYTTDSERNTIVTNEHYAGNISEIANERTNQKNYSDASATSVKISRINSSGDKNYSFGLWGILYYNNSSASYLVNYNDKQNYPGTGGGGTVAYNNSVTNQNVNRDNSRLAAGIEFSFNNKSIDYIGRIGYQFNKAPEETAFDKTSNHIDSSYNFDPPSFNNQFTRSTLNGSLGGNTNGIDLYSYICHAAGLITPNDRMFMSLYAFHTGGDKSYSGILREEGSYLNSNGNNSFDTSFAEQSNKLSVRNDGLFLSAGYAVRLNLGDINLLSGLKILGIYSDTKDVDANINSSSSSFYEFTYTKKAAEFVIPVYLNYSPESWISLYGGINFAYSYTNEKLVISDEHFNYNSYLNINNNSRDRISNDTYWRSKKVIYAGFELRHSSGLRIQTYIDESFSNIRDWNVSVGYHF